MRQRHELKLIGQPLNFGGGLRAIQVREQPQVVLDRQPVEKAELFGLRQERRELSRGRIVASAVPYFVFVVRRIRDRHLALAGDDRIRQIAKAQ